MPAPGLPSRSFPPQRACSPTSRRRSKRWGARSSARFGRRKFMSRVGKQPVPIPEKVSVKIEGSTVKIKGPLGELTKDFPALVKVEQKDKALVLTADKNAAP